MRSVIELAVTHRIPTSANSLRPSRQEFHGGEDDPHVYKDGYTVWARFTDPELPMVLYVPHDLADEFEPVGRGRWSGRGCRSAGRIPPSYL